MYLEYRDMSGKTVHLPLNEEGEPITIGRNPGSTIYVKESTVSRNHGRIGFDGDTWYIKDLGSSNGSFHNNERTTRAQITGGDLVRIGEVFEIKVIEGSPEGGRSPSRGERSRRNRPTSLGRADNSADERRRRNAEREAERDRRRRAREDRRAPAAESKPAPKPKKPEPAPPSPRASKRHQETGQSRVVQAVDDSSNADVAELKRKVAALEGALADAERRADQSENEAKSAEARAMRYSVELEGISEKYIKLKEQNRVISTSLEETREEQRQREDDAFEAERKVSDLERELETARTKAADATEQLSGLKVRVTQKDRQIEELQRQLDLLEYELRSHRDEIEMLQADFNRGGGETDRLERKVNLLQEVIQEKESVIEQLRVDLRDKDIEIRQARMGVGISDLEHEKRGLLEDYHNAMRRNDELADKVEKQRRDKEQLQAEVDRLNEAAEERRSAAPQEIDDHPDFKAKVRELERAAEQLEQAQGDLAAAEEKLESMAADGDSVAKLEGELSVLQKRNDKLQERLDAAEQKVTELQEIEDQAPAGPTVPIGVSEDIEALQDAAAASKSNARLVRKYAQTLEKGVDKGGDLGEAAELLYDIAVVLVQDITEQVRMVTELQDKFGSEDK